MSKFIPLLDRILIQKFVPKTKSASGLIIPESAQVKLNEGKVIAVGKGVFRDGKIVPNDVAVGDKVVLPEYGGSKIKLEQQEFFIFRNSEILGKYSEKL